jgi:hypothetical protein
VNVLFKLIFYILKIGQQQVNNRVFTLKIFEFIYEDIHKVILSTGCKKNLIIISYFVGRFIYYIEICSLSRPIVRP